MTPKRDLSIFRRRVDGSVPAPSPSDGADRPTPAARARTTALLERVDPGSLLEAGRGRPSIDLRADDGPGDDGGGAEGGGAEGGAKPRSTTARRAATSATARSKSALPSKTSDTYSARKRRVAVSLPSPLALAVRAYADEHEWVLGDLVVHAAKHHEPSGERSSTHTRRPRRTAGSGTQQLVLYLTESELLTLDRIARATGSNRSAFVATILEREVVFDAVVTVPAADTVPADTGMGEVARDPA